MTKNPPAKKTGEQLMAEDAIKATAITQTVDAIAQEKLEMNQLLGRIQATHAIGNMLEALGLSQLQAIKEQKAYRQLQGQTKEINGKAYDLATWKGFCRAIGTTQATVDEKLNNLRILGEAALENAQNLGMTTRELAKLRKLDPSDQNVIIGELEANIGDKDAIVELIENMSAKHVKEKEALEAKINEEKAEREASKRVISQKSETIIDLQKQIYKQERLTLDDKIELAYSDLNETETDSITQVKNVRAIVEAALSLDDKGVEHRVTAMMLNIRNELDDIMVAFNLEYVEFNRAIDDSWIGEHEEQLDLPLGLTPDENDDEVIVGELIDDEGGNEGA